MAKRCIVTADDLPGILYSDDNFATFTEVGMPEYQHTLWPVVGDNSGNWVVGGYDAVTPFAKIFYSHDNGVTWYDSDFVGSEYGEITAIATDNLGNWVAVTGSGSGYYGHILLSTDNGETWTIVHICNDGDPDGYSLYRDIESVRYGNGAWVAITRCDIYRSTDGSTWAPIEYIDDNPSLQSVATDGAGNWLIVATYGNYYNAVLDTDPSQVYGSDDNGLTWSLVYQDDTEDYFWSIETDKNGVWCIGTESWGGRSLIFRSTDLGVSWDEVFYRAGGIQFYTIATDEQGTWIATCWTSEGYALLLIAEDDGETWEPWLPETDNYSTFGVAFGGSLCPAPEINVGDVDFV